MGRGEGKPHSSEDDAAVGYLVVEVEPSRKGTLWKLGGWNERNVLNDGSGNSSGIGHVHFLKEDLPEGGKESRFRRRILRCFRMRSSRGVTLSR